MLMQNFKTAKELYLNDQQYDALKKTLVLMETSKIKYVKIDYESKRDQSTEYTGHFNMAYWGSKHDCGTVACIGGTAELISGEKDLFGPILFQGHLRTHSALHNLFCPPNMENWPKITVKQAATALRSYLATGDAHWEEIL